MAKKMYYTEQEAAERLGIPADELAKLVRDDKLRVFQDGPRKMFKTAEVDAIAPPAEEEIELAPADSVADQVSLSEADRQPPAKSKEDTVITAEGISIFDDEDLEIEAADPMAKTQITPSLEEQISTEGVGSGSGLLDLTRESDDTSLGAEVLSNIDMGDVEQELGVADVVPEAPRSTPAAVVELAPAEEVSDGPSGLFGGIAIACAAVSLLLALVALTAAEGALPNWVAALKENAPVVLIGAIVVIAILAVVGMMMGKSIAARRRAMSRMGA